MVGSGWVLSTALFLCTFASSLPEIWTTPPPPASLYRLARNPLSPNSRRHCCPLRLHCSMKLGRLYQPRQAVLWRPAVRHCLATDTFRSPLLQGHPVPFSFNWVVPSRIGLPSQWQVELLIFVAMQISFLLLWHNTQNFLSFWWKRKCQPFLFFNQLVSFWSSYSNFLGSFRCISKGIKCDLCFRHKIFITLYKR